MTPKDIIKRGLLICAFPYRWVRALNTLSGGTDYKRWRRNVRIYPSWDDRNKRIAALIPNGSRVIDLGAGAQTLRLHLGRDCLYQPCDLVKSSTDCILCEFNKGVYPNTEHYYDYVVCSGVLEYIKQPDNFIARIVEYGDRVVLSYNAWDGRNRTKLSRLSAGWMNHLRQVDLEKLFEKVSIVFEQVDDWEGHIIYQLHSARSDGRIESKRQGHLGKAG